MRIVLVDQSRTIARIVTELVRADGHQVLAFADGRKALACLECDNDVRCLITSVQLESLPGIELCAAARELAGSRRPLYIMLMSSSDDRDIIVRALDRGADDFIHKPPDVEELRARLRLADRVTSMQRELIRYGTLDSLSELLNRREFFYRAAQAQHRAEMGTPLSAIMLDIDHFKRINDIYGHDAGDRAIVAVASQVKRCNGIAGRLGGEEFCLLLEQDLLPARNIAEELRQAISSMRFEVNNESAAGLTASFGVAQWHPGETIDRLLQRADIALYGAKNAGRNCVFDAQPDAQPHSPPQWRSVVRARGARQ
ncbi:MAG: diguanylate cyclase [Alphaproteobacteria bacterium]|nr:MAG: diguanylate cyclase [Alphaproteobacteria bacterium]